MVKKNITDDARIAVKSLVSHIYYTCSQTFETFAWEEAGDIQEMTLIQLRIMKAKHPRYFSEKWIRPLDDEVLDKLNLRQFYENNLCRGDFKKLSGNDLEEANQLLDSLNSDALKALVPKVLKAVKSGQIANVRIIRLLESKLGIQLMNLV